MARAYFCIISTLLLVVSLFALYRELTPEWKEYQGEYYRVLSTFEEDPGHAEQVAATPLRIQQIFDPEYGLVDRCTTCHAAYDDPRFAEAGQPLRTHSAGILEDHPIPRIGCAVCHDGNGYATSVEAAHGREEHSEFPLLVGVWVETRCVRCHADGRRVGAVELARGLGLIERAACFACHAMKGVARRPRIAPALDGIGSKVKPEWLRSWLLEPRSYLEGTLMPDYGLSDEEAVNLTAYLMSLGNSALEIGAPGEPPEATLARGRELWESAACGDCHSVEGSAGFEGIIAPALSRIGEKVNAAWVAMWLREPRHLQRGAEMPAYGLSAADAQALAAYLVTTFRAEGEETAKESSPDPELRALLQEPARIEAGRELVRELACLACHTIGGEGLPITPGPDLSDVGDWDASHLEWGQAPVPPGAGLREFLAVKVGSPRAFGDEVGMPTFGFSPEEVQAIVVALLSFARNPVPMEARLQLPADRSSLPLPSGAVKGLFDRYQCLACHPLQGRFGQMAPELGYEGERVQREWLIEYLVTPHLIRPLAERRMPDFGVTREEAELMATFIEVAWRDDRIPGDPFQGQAPTPEQIARGEELVNEEYACMACHDPESETGPDLAGAGSRLKPGWIYQFVRAPQLLFENEMEDEDVGEEDALAITAYLMSLKE